MMALLAVLTVAAVWLLVTALRWRAAQREPRLSASLLELVGDSLNAIDIDRLYLRLADTLETSLAPAKIVLYAAHLVRGVESWSLVHPLTLSLSPENPSTRVLSLAARAPRIIGRQDELRDEGDQLVGVRDLLDELGVDWLLPVHYDAGEALVVGVRLRPRANATDMRLLENWRVCASAVMQAQALRFGDVEYRELANEAEMAKFLEAVALSPIEGQGHGLDWAVRFHASADRPYFLTTYTPSATKMLVVFGRAIASGVAASLLNVSIKSCCDVMVKLIGPDVSVLDLTDRLNRFLWQPKRPVGAYCHLLLVDRAAGRLEIASAGTSTLTRVYAKEGKRKMARLSCEGLPLGTSIDGTWKVQTSALQTGDGFLVWTEGSAETGSEVLILPSRSTKDDITAEKLIEEALAAQVDTPCLLAVAVR